VFAIINATVWARGVSLLLCIVLASSLAACALGPHKSEAERQADRATAERVESALSADHELFSRHITVKADNGVVRLTGFVWDPPDLVDAERIAEAVPGVTRVVNSLELQRNGMDNSPVSR
jgi:osmotically-inducible protein OsmY